MARDYQWNPNIGMHQRAMLPPYRYPDWMTSANYNLVYFGIPRPLLQDAPYQQNYRQMWDSQNRRQQIPQARRVEEKVSTRKRGRGSSPQLRITVNGRQGGYQEDKSQKRKISSARDARIPSDSKRIKTSRDSSSGSSSHSSNHIPTKHTTEKKIPTTDNKKSPVPDIAEVSRQADKLSAEMWDYYKRHAQEDVHYKDKEELRTRLEYAISRVCEGCHLFLVGSSLSGFGCRRSDADFCLLLTLGEVDQKSDARHILQVVHKHLKRYSFVRNSIVIHAKVPILRFVDKITGIECDININNITGIRNTHLMHAYSKADRRVVPLVMWIKHWAKSNGINDASQGTMSSYAIVLLVLHYLQAICSPPVIPCLQRIYPRLFNYNKDVFTLQAELNHPSRSHNILFKSKNTESLGELVTGFFRHVSNFPFRENIMSVRLASSFPLTSDWRKQYMHIEEPFERANVARAVYQGDRYQDILFKFRQAYETLISDRKCSLEDLVSLKRHSNSQLDEPPPQKKKTKRERIKEALDFLKRRESGKKT